ncbi:MAG TPA: ATP-binding protein, partial [Burkholderiales bacterium]|nr:ATP-binding protein [Burkholderiales bacterium]
ALAAIRLRKPDLVLSDVMMPNLDGLGLVRALRENPETQTLPVILLSARAGQEASLEGLAAGAHDYLAKPFTAQELLARVRTHLNMAKLRNELTTKLKHANDELTAFSYSVSHDLRAPVRAIHGFTRIFANEYGEKIDAKGNEYLARILSSAKRMGELIDDLLKLSQIGHRNLRKRRINLSEIARSICEDLTRKEPARHVEFIIPGKLFGNADSGLLRILFENLFGNAMKFTARTAKATIEFGVKNDSDHCAFFIRDNGVGFDATYATRLFQPFQRLHNEIEFPGTGIGLATVRRIVERHGGLTWAESVVGKGATIFFTLPAMESSDAETQ